MKDGATAATARKAARSTPAAARLPLAASLAVLLAILPVACSAEPTPRADARHGRGAEAAQNARSDTAAAAGGRAMPAGPASRVSNTSSTDTLAPLAPPGTPASAFPEPDRPVAKITTDTWSDEETRDKAGEAERVMSLLGVEEGMRVADVGAGGGYYTVRLARRIGPSGHVLAEDIIPRYLEGLQERVQREQLSNVTVALGDPHDPRLPPQSVDLALLVHMYHEVEQPYGLLYNLYPALRPRARVAVVDLDRSTSRHGTPPKLLACEFAAVGYELLETHDLGKARGYLAVFEPPASRAELTVPDSIEACAA